MGGARSPNNEMNDWKVTNYVVCLISIVVVPHMANKYFCIRRLHYSLVKIHFCKVNKGVCLCIFLRVRV